MRQLLVIGTVVALAAAGAAAEESDVRAWQRRLEVSVPVPVPTVALEAVNPFAVGVDVEPRLLQFRSPEKVDVRVQAAAAVYVDADGEARGAVPLELPFPGVAAELVGELTGSRFDPARVGGAPRPSWPVVEVRLEGRIKSGTVLEQQLERPDPDQPPQPSPPIRVAPPGNLVNLPTTPSSELTTLASPKRLRVKLDDRESDVSLRAMVLVGVDGRCLRFVPLDVDSGLLDWLAAYLGSWRLEPARHAGDAIDCWMLYTARIRFDLSNFKSETVRVAVDRVYLPDQQPG